MIPKFPNFKKLELGDKKDIEKITKHYPPCSDFNFASMWCWDVKKETLLSILNGNLVVKFSDYLSGESFFSYYGKENIHDTALRLLHLSRKKGYRNFLKLILEDFIGNLRDYNEFSILESRDHNDYIYSIRDLMMCKGRCYETMRRQINRFNRGYPMARTTKLDLNSPKDRKMITNLNIQWEINKKMEIPREKLALIKFLNFYPKKNLSAVGLKDERGKLIAFSIDEILKGNYALCHFAKADINFPGVYYRLMKEVARELDKAGIRYLNYEQDLGIEGLRRAKMNFRPSFFLKKYEISFSIR